MGCPALGNTPHYEGTAPHYVIGELRQKKNMALMKEQLKAPKLELSDEEIANL